MEGHRLDGGAGLVLVRVCFRSVSHLFESEMLVHCLLIVIPLFLFQIPIMVCRSPWG